MFVQCNQIVRENDCCINILYKLTENCNFVYQGHNKELFFKKWGALVVIEFQAKHSPAPGKHNFGESYLNC